MRHLPATQLRAEAPGTPQPAQRPEGLPAQGADLIAGRLRERLGAEEAARHAAEGTDQCQRVVGGE